MTQGLTCKRLSIAYMSLITSPYDKRAVFALRPGISPFTHSLATWLTQGNGKCFSSFDTLFERDDPSRRRFMPKDLRDASYFKYVKMTSLTRKMHRRRQRGVPSCKVLPLLPPELRCYKSPNHWPELESG